MLKANIHVILKKTLFDPQGLAAQHALNSMGYEKVESVRIGKFITLNIDSTDRVQAEKELEQMCEKLLANPVIEDYSITIEEG